MILLWLVAAGLKWAKSCWTVCVGFLLLRAGRGEVGVRSLRWQSCHRGLHHPLLHTLSRLSHDGPTLCCTRAPGQANCRQRRARHLGRRGTGGSPGSATSAARTPRPQACVPRWLQPPRSLSGVSSSEGPSPCFRWERVWAQSRSRLGEPGADLMSSAFCLLRAERSETNGSASWFPAFSYNSSKLSINSKMWHKHHYSVGTSDEKGTTGRGRGIWTGLNGSDAIINFHWGIWVEEEGQNIKTISTFILSSFDRWDYSLLCCLWFG